MLQNMDKIKLSDMYSDMKFLLKGIEDEIK